jgi:hypothetical protein
MMNKISIERGARQHDQRATRPVDKTGDKQ